MRNEKQVCLLEQAKKLKELGVLQTSVWFWEEMRKPIPDGWCSQRLQLHANTSHPLSAGVVEDNFSAYNVAELGPILVYMENKKVVIPDDVEKKYFTSKDDLWAFYNPAFLADALIYALELGRVTVEEINLILVEERNIEPTPTVQVSDTTNDNRA